MFKKLFILMFILTIVPAVFAGTTGKIAGVVKDKQTGEPLPGVNVLIQGTTLGASTDIDGYYVIVNVPVGVHELQVSYIGYKDILIYNVRVVADATTRYDFEMEQTLLEVSEVIEVTAERELIEADNTASRTTYTAEVMKSQPVTNVQNTVALTAGVVEGSFRGGRTGVGEVKYLLDGVDISNPMGTVNRGMQPGQGDDEMATDVVEGAVEEVQVITGGMSAQYDAKSAVINMVSRSGGSEFSGYLRTTMTPSEYGDGNIIGYSAGQPTGYMSDAEAIAEAHQVGTGGPDINEDYYASPSKMFLNPKFRRYEIGFGGPISLKGVGVGGNLSFNISGDFLDQGGFYRGASAKQETWNFKLVYNTAANSTWTLTYNTSHRDQTNASHTYSRIVTTGDTLYGYNAGSEKPNKILVGSIVYPDGRLEAVQDYDMLQNLRQPEYNSNLLNFTYKNTVSSKTFYELRVSRFYTAGKHRTYDPATGKALGLEDFRTTRFASPANAEFFPVGAPTAQLVESYWYVQPMVVSRNRQDDEQTSWTFAGNLVSQLNENNELRLGAEFIQYDIYDNYESFASGGNGYTSFLDHLSPRRLSMFAEDKIETAGMILNLGLRFDYFDPNAFVPENFEDPLKEAAKDPTSPLYQDPTTSAEERIKNPTAANQAYKLSPRLGISFPITERDVFHVNYGHYFGMPNLGNLYDNYTWALLGAFRYLGNPNLKHEKIISYEAGIQHAFSDDVKLVVTGFYKDIADLVNKVRYQDEVTGTPYWVNTNADFAAVTGFEVGVRTRRVFNSILYLNYTYSSAKGKNSDAEQAFLDDYRNRRPRTDSFPLDWDVTHTLSLNYDFRIPENYWGSQWTDDWGVNLVLTYNSGRPYTSANTVPQPYLPAVNDRRYPGWTNVNTRIYKNFSLWGSMKFGAFLDVFNLFNNRVLRTIMNEEQYDQGFDEGDGTQNIPWAWATPRTMRLGFELFF
jgi:outer membrane receptor for ferrienterochelin and colicin